MVWNLTKSSKKSSVVPGRGWCACGFFLPKKRCYLNDCREKEGSSAELRKKQKSFIRICHLGAPWCFSFEDRLHQLHPWVTVSILLLSKNKLCSEVPSCIQFPRSLNAIHESRWNCFRDTECPTSLSNSGNVTQIHKKISSSWSFHCNSPKALSWSLKLQHSLYMAANAL